MREDELRAILSAQYESALGESTSSRLTERRMETLKRYRMEKYGDEIDGRSKVVSGDVFDTIESALPALLKIFAGTDKIAECEPVGPEDEAGARQATDYMNHVFLKDNNGFLVLHNWFKDGLLQINGFVKVFWEEKEIWSEKRHTGLTQEQIPLLLQGEDYIVSEMLERTEVLPDGTPIQVFDVRYKCRTMEKLARVVSVAPEDVGIAPGTLDLDECAYSYCRDDSKTVSDLIEMGYDKELVKKAVSDPEEGYEREIRADFEETHPGVDYESIDETMRTVPIVEHYVRLDYDGDGIAEYRKITTAGSDHLILDNEELEENPLVTFTPIILPHQTFGMALAETVLPIAEVKTTLQRQLLDNLYRQNSSRLYVDQTKVNENTISDILNDVPGGIIRGDGEKGVSPIDVQPIGQEIFTAIEYQDTIKEQRSGVTRYNQGLDADSLNKTATGMQIIENNSQERQMLTARIAGEAVRRLFGKLLRLTIRHQDVPRVVRLRNEWVNVDPREWNAEMDIAISVGLGTGSKDQMLGHLMNIWQMQQVGLQVGIVTPDQLAHTVEKTVENMGFKDVEQFVMGEQQLQEQAQQQQMNPPPPNPDEMKLQFEQQKAQTDLEMQQQKMALDQQKAQSDAELKLQIEREKIASQERIAMAKIQADTESKREMSEAASKPTTTVQFSGEEVLGQVAQNLQGLAVDQSQTNQAVLQGIGEIAQGMAQMSQMMVMAMERMNQPKQVQIVRDSSGKMAGAAVTIQ